MSRRTEELPPKAPTDAELLAIVEITRSRLPQALPVIAWYAAIALAVVGAATASAYLFEAARTTVHGARSEILYQLDEERATGFLREDRRLSTQRVLIESGAVLGKVAREHDLTVDDLADKVHTSVVDSSEILRIEVRDRSARRAESLVAEITQAYLDEARAPGITASRQYLEDELAAIDAERAATTARLAELELERLAAAATAPPDSPEGAATPGAEELALQAELESLLDRRVETQSRLEETTVEEMRLPRVEQVSDPSVLSKPVSPNPERAALAGMLLGVVLAASLIGVLVWRRSLETPL